MAHELGHALGRDHAPCDISAQNSGPFPYKGGKIGVWGFDSVNHTLLDPLLYGDVMGYCSPDWISDFTYRALFKRLKQVNAEVGGARARRCGHNGAPIAGCSGVRMARLAGDRVLRRVPLRAEIFES